MAAFWTVVGDSARLLGGQLRQPPADELTQSEPAPGPATALGAHRGGFQRAAADTPRLHQPGIPTVLVMSPRSAVWSHWDYCSSANCVNDDRVRFR